MTDLVSLKTWLLAHWFGLACIGMYTVLEWWLPRTKWFKANSLIEALANFLKRLLIDRVPLVGIFIRLLASPAPAAAPAQREEPKPPSSALLVLFIGGSLVFGVVLAGCHGYKAPTYGTLAVIAGGADVAVEQLPPACEAIENAAVDAATSRADATAAADALHARCQSTLTTIKGIGLGLKSARDAVHDAPDGQLPTEAGPWLRVLLKQYCDAVPLLALFHISLPGAGLC
jgi:hypothetical protein